MLRNQQFKEWCNQLGLSPQTCEIVQQIRVSEPIRRVGGGGKNVCGRYPSQKMGRTIQFESHKVELPAIEEYESSIDVLEYYDQPLKLTLSYESKSGRRIVCSHVPDFFVMRQSSSGFEEWKSEARLKILAQSQPHRYCQSESGDWYSPPVDKCVEALGVYYRLRTDREINWTLHRNRQFLRSYLNQGYIVVDEVSTALKLTVADAPGITLTELIQEARDGSVDDIHALIATRQLYVDLEHELLAEPNHVHLFQDSHIAEAYAVVKPCFSTTTTRNLQILNVAVGMDLSWDGKSLTILQRGATQIVLRGESGLIQLSYDEFSRLVHQGSITGLTSLESSTKETAHWEHICRASPRDLEIANQRYRMIEHYLQGQSTSGGSVPERTIRYWKAKFRTAQETYG